MKRKIMQIVVILLLALVVSVYCVFYLDNKYTCSLNYLNSSEAPFDRKIVNFKQAYEVALSKAKLWHSNSCLTRVIIKFNSSEQIESRRGKLDFTFVINDIGIKRYGYVYFIGMDLGKQAITGIQSYGGEGIRFTNYINIEEVHTDIDDVFNLMQSKKGTEYYDENSDISVEMNLKLDTDGSLVWSVENYYRDRNNRIHKVTIKIDAISGEIEEFRKDN